MHVRNQIAVAVGDGRRFTVASFGLFDATGDKAGNCDMKSRPATTASVMRRVL